MEVNQKQIFNFESLSSLFNWKAAKIASLRDIKVTPGYEDVSVKYNFFDDYTKVRVLKKNKKIEDVTSFKVSLAYTQRIPLNDKKKSDLNSMITKKLIPPEHKNDFSEVLYV